MTQILNVVHHGPAVCVNLLPASEWLHLYQALVCGLPISDGGDRQLFLDSGLIHLMVVSGAHLVFLEQLMSGCPRRLRLATLILYCWLTGFGPPAVKALFRRIAEHLLQGYGWTSLQTEAMAVALTLTVIPQWILSRSLLMSWICTLAFCLPLWLRWKPLDQAVKAYLLLVAFVAASPLTILWNALLAPVVGQILFPLTLLLMPLPFLELPVSQVWRAFLYLVEVGPKAPPAPWFVPTLGLFWFPFVLHLGLLIAEVRWRRARAFSS